MTTCPTCGAANAPGSRFCQACGGEQQVRERTVRKTVTVLFADVADWTKLTQTLDPESTRQVQELFFGAMATAITRHGGLIEQFAGDGVYAVFGLPSVHEDDALRAVRAGVEMHERMVGVNEELGRRFGKQVEIRVGINTGEVAVGTGTTIATGPAVNLGRRLEEAAPPGEILVGASTYRLVRRVVDALALRIDAHGYHEPVQAFRVDGVLSETEPARGRRFRSQMVGRRQERDLLLHAFERSVSARTCQLFTIAGPAGVGKSRLVEEVLAEVGDRARSLSGRCLPYGEGITFWPVAEVVRQAFALGERGAGDTRLTIARELERRGEPEADVVAEAVANLIGTVESSVGAEEGFRAVRKLLEALTADGPLVVVFDDIQWGEPTFLDLVEHLADWAREAPLLLVCMARPELYEERPGWGGGKINVTSIMLEPLDDDEADLLIAGLLGDDVEPGARRRIAGSAEGNPLFVEEILEMLIEDGLLVRRGGGWAGATELSLEAIPPTIHALLEARLERLDAEERAVLERAAVEGKVFHRGAVAALCGPGTDVELQLTRLVRKEVIRRDRTVFAEDDAFRFRHILIRDAAYGSLSKLTRAELHEQYADWLEQAAGERLPELEEIAGYHLEQACRYRLELDPGAGRDERLAARAAARLEAVARRALTRGDLPAAINLLQRSSALLPVTDPARVSLLTELGATLMEAAKLPEADRVLTEAAEAASALGDERLRAHALVAQLLLRLQVTTDATAEAMTAVNRLLPLFERYDDELGSCRTRRLEAWVHWIQGRIRSAETAWLAAAEHARRAAAERDEAEVLVWLASAGLFGPTPVRIGIDRCESVRPRLASRPIEEALSLYPLAGLHAMLGDFDDARGLIARAKATLADYGVTLSANSHSEAVVEMLAGDPAAAEACLRVDYDNLTRVGEKGFLSTTAVLLARAVLMQDRHSEAHELTDVAEQTGARDDVSTQIGWRGVRAAILAARGEVDEARRLAHEAVALAEQTDRLNDQGDAFADLAAVLDRAERGAESVAPYDEALRRYELKGNVVAAERIRAALAAAAASGGLKAGGGRG